MKKWYLVRERGSESEAAVTRDARGPYAWLAAVIGLVAAVVWASLGVRAIVMDNDPSTSALVACAALALVGFALTPVIWMLTAPIRAKRPPSDFTQMRVPHVMLGIMVIGMGASPTLDASPNAWDWALMVVASLAGGLNLGIAFMGFAGQATLSDAPRQSTGAGGSVSGSVT